MNETLQFMMRKICAGSLGRGVQAKWKREFEERSFRQELKENFYHGFLLGLLRSREDWKVISNREGGTGYTDIVIEIFPQRIGIVIEIKYAENGDMEAGCRSALKQIEAQGYTDQPRLDGMTEIIACGIACCTKNCQVVFSRSPQNGEL